MNRWLESVCFSSNDWQVSNINWQNVCMLCPAHRYEHRCYVLLFFNRYKYILIYWFHEHFGVQNMLTKGLNYSICPIARNRCRAMVFAFEDARQTCKFEHSGNPFSLLQITAHHPSMAFLLFQWFYKTIFIGQHVYPFCPWYHICCVKLIIYLDHITSIVLIPVLQY